MQNVPSVFSEIHNLQSISLTLFAGFFAWWGKKKPFIQKLPACVFVPKKKKKRRHSAPEPISKVAQHLLKQKHISQRVKRARQKYSAKSKPKKKSADWNTSRHNAHMFKTQQELSAASMWWIFPKFAFRYPSFPPRSCDNYS